MTRNVRNADIMCDTGQDHKIEVKLRRHNNLKGNRENSSSNKQI